jgi:hypothetical protein
MGRNGKMLKFDDLKQGFYDPKLGLIKIGILLARKYPGKVDDFIQCRTMTEVANVGNIPTIENIHDSGVRLLKEWLEAKGLL